MLQRGRKSAAQRAVIAAIQPSIDHEPSKPAHEPPPPPSHLQPETKVWWTSIVTEYELERYQLHILQAAGEAWDLYQQARGELAQHGLTFVDDKGMIRARPEAAIARDARTSFLRAVRELKLNVEPPKPPRLGGYGVTWEQLHNR
jgi:phage terminase small subunit